MALENNKRGKGSPIRSVSKLYENLHQFKTYTNVFLLQMPSVTSCGKGV